MAFRTVQERSVIPRPKGANYRIDMQLHGRWTPTSSFRDNAPLNSVSKALANY
jgi:hypothetical protein